MNRRWWLWRTVVSLTAGIGGGVLFARFAPDSWVDWLLSPSMPQPPQWLARFDVWFLRHAASPLYVVQIAVWGSVWFILLRQRRPRETPAARWVRRGVGAEALFWVALAMGRYLAEAWRPTFYVAVVLWLLVVGVAILVAFTRTYTLPGLRGGGNGSDGGDVVPPSSRPERRKNRFDRRRFPPPARPA